MVRIISRGDRVRYECEKCGFRYDEKPWAEQCEMWCAKHASCNLEIISHGIPPESETDAGNG